MSIRSIRTLRRMSAVVASLAMVLAVPAVAQAAPSGSPIGNLDNVTVVDDGVRVRGWVWDPSTTAAVDVTVTVGTTTHELVASSLRADVARVFPDAGSYRGFDVVLPGAFGVTEVCMRGHNVGAGADFVRCTSVVFDSAPPRGWLERVTDAAGTVAVRGWAGDPDGGDVTVRLTSGSTTVDVAATAPRADVTRVFPDLDGTTGFTASLDLGAGTHTVCATALNTGTGVDTPIGCRDVSVADHSPSGALLDVQDVEGGLRVRASATDPDSATVAVRFASGSTVVTRTTSTSGVAEAVLPVGVGSHEVCATAINTGVGTDTPLGCLQGTVVEHNPTGTLTSVVDAAGSTMGLLVRASVADVDATSPMTLALSVDGTRQDVTASSTGAVEAFLPLTAGAHTVCATALNVGRGSDTALGCTTAQVVDHRPVGNLDSVAPEADGARVVGWATDPDSTEPVTVRLVVDGSTTLTSAGGAPTASRTTASTATAGAAQSGFEVLVPLAPGTHEVCVTAQNIGAGSDTDLGCSSVVVPEAETRMPDAGNTGVPAGTSLTVHQGDLVITKAGTVIDGWDIRGYVEIKAVGVVIRNSILRGGTPGSYSRGLVTVGSAAYSVTIEDSELVPSVSSPLNDGLRGMNITARRVNVHGVVDAVHIYGDNVSITDSWLHDNAWFAVDPNQGGKPSHDDSVQIQIGKNITLVHNTITGASNAAIMLTQDRGLVSGLTVSDNFLDHGACTVNIKNMPTAPVDVVLHDNTFGRNAQYRSCGIKVPNTSYQLDLLNNLYVDGAVVTLTR